MKFAAALVSIGWAFVAMREFFAWALIPDPTLAALMALAIGLGFGITVYLLCRPDELKGAA